MFALCSLKYQWSTPRGTPGNFGPNGPTPVDLSVGDIRSQIIAAEWLQIAQRSQWRAYIETSKPPSLFRMVPSLRRWPPTTSPSSKMGFHMPPIYANGHISATGDPICLVLGWGFQGRRTEWRYFYSCSLLCLLFRDFVAIKGHWLCFSFWLHVSCITQLSFRIHVKLCYRIVSYVAHPQDFLQPYWAYEWHICKFLAKVTRTSNFCKCDYSL